MQQQVQEQAGKRFDVIVIGSGASGGWVAKQLTEAGVQVALLDAAALTAVGQWSYTPSLLNGVPVPVIMTVTVTFKLR